MSAKSVLLAKTTKALKSAGPKKSSAGRNKVSTRVEKDMGTAERVNAPKLSGPTAKAPQPKTSGGRNKAARGAAKLAATAGIGVGIGMNMGPNKKIKAPTNPGVSKEHAKAAASQSMAMNKAKRVAKNPKPKSAPRPANTGAANVSKTAKANAGVRANTGKRIPAAAIARATKGAKVQEGPSRKPVMPKAKTAKKGLSEATREGRDKFLSAAYASGGYVEKKAGGGIAGMMKSYIEANHPAYKKTSSKTILRDNAPKASSSPMPKSKGGGRRQLLADKYQNMSSNQYACGGFVQRKAVGGVAQTTHTQSVRKISNK